MAFRQSSSKDRSRNRDWDRWIEQHAARLKSIGLPPEVYLDLRHWEDFLENGHLHFHPESSTDFEFGQLSNAQQQKLLEFLMTKNEFEPKHFPLPGYLRVRLEESGMNPENTQ
jgi:hypothetical protein